MHVVRTYANTNLILYITLSGERETDQMAGPQMFPIIIADSFLPTAA